MSALECDLHGSDLSSVLFDDIPEILAEKPTCLSGTGGCRLWETPTRRGLIAG